MENLIFERNMVTQLFALTEIQKLNLSCPTLQYIFDGYGGELFVGQGHLFTEISAQIRRTSSI